MDSVLDFLVFLVGAAFGAVLAAVAFVAAHPDAVIRGVGVYVAIGLVGARVLLRITERLQGGSTGGALQASGAEWLMIHAFWPLLVVAIVMFAVRRIKRASGAFLRDQHKYRLPV